MGKTGRVIMYSIPKNFGQC